MVLHLDAEITTDDSPRGSLAPAGQLVAPFAPAQIGLDGLPYDPAGGARASEASQDQAPGREAASPHLGPYTSFPAPSPPAALSALPGQLELPFDQYDRQHTMWSVMDPRTQPTEHRRMGKCGKVSLGRGELAIERGENGTWSPSGFVRCNTWQCPTCGPRRAHERAALLSAAIAKHRRRDAFHDTWLLTFTIWHHAGETQREKFDRLHAAWDTFAKSRQWKRFRERFGVVDVVRCLDETFGRNGVHPHFHVLLFVEHAVIGFMPIRGLGIDERNELLADVAGEQLIEPWSDAVRETGVWPVKESVQSAFRKHSVDMRGGDDAATYVVKWGMADEAVMSPRKRFSRTDLLNLACAGDPVAAQWWREWADATRGRNFCTGTGKLRERLVLSDEEIQEHREEMRRRREAEELKQGKEPKPKRPRLRIVISYVDLPTVVRLGWGAIVRAAEHAEDVGRDPQRLVDHLLMINGPPARVADG